MGSVGDCFDNAVTESFVTALEANCCIATGSAPAPRLAWPSSTTGGVYNPRRRHSAPGQRSPAYYEQSYQAQYAAAQP
jgi:transposase InsO family protein